MANLAYGKCAAVLPMRFVKEFLACFADSLNEKCPPKKVLFGTDYANAEVMHNQKGMALLKFDIECRWSLKHCMLDKHEPYETLIYAPLREILDIFAVRRLTALAWEPGIGFEESITFDRAAKNALRYDVRDMFASPENLSLDDDESDDCGNAA